MSKFKRITWRGYSGRLHVFKRRVWRNDNGDWCYRDDNGGAWVLCPAINYSVVKVEDWPKRKRKKGTHAS